MTKFNTYYNKTPRKLELDEECLQNSKANTIFNVKQWMHSKIGNKVRMSAFTALTQQSAQRSLNSQQKAWFIKANINELDLINI